LRDEPFQVSSVDAKPYRRSPYAPFRTTTLQQEASRKLGYGAARTMQVAQQLYENGLITYMRTDSVTLSEAAVAARARSARALRRRVPADAPRALHQQGQERPGGARGDPPGRRHLRNAGAGARWASDDCASTS
jgi:DNA topoisomerase IA